MREALQRTAPPLPHLVNLEHGRIETAAKDAQHDAPKRERWVTIVADGKEVLGDVVAVADDLSRRHLCRITAWLEIEDLAVVLDRQRLDLFVDRVQALCLFRRRGRHGVGTLQRGGKEGRGREEQGPDGQARDDSGRSISAPSGPVICPWPPSDSAGQTEWLLHPFPAMVPDRVVRA